MEKIDLKKTLPDYFKPSAGKFSIVKFPKYNYLMVNGKGDPYSAPEYVEAIELLYGAAHRLKFMPENGYTSNGKHHEIYLGDLRKAAPSKLKTILRQPVKKN